MGKIGSAVAARLGGGSLSRLGTKLGGKLAGLGTKVIASQLGSGSLVDKVKQMAIDKAKEIAVNQAGAFVSRIGDYGKEKLGGVYNNLIEKTRKAGVPDAVIAGVNGGAEHLRRYAISQGQNLANEGIARLPASVQGVANSLVNFE
tara:strand:+ start:502 stop:939 length:438 start_codon:yes stop_codon:yes gene_type:complete